MILRAAVPSCWFTRNRLHFHSSKEIYDHYHTLTKKTDTDLWVFRGQADASWGLSTRLERELRKAECPTNVWGFMEEGLVREFQRRLPSTDANVKTPDVDNILAWMALMQHHGTPTRLL